MSGDITWANFRGLARLPANQAALTLREDAETIDQAMRDIASILDNVVWQGEDATKFMRDWNIFYPQIFRTTSTMRARAQELEDRICRQEIVSGEMS